MVSFLQGCRGAVRLMSRVTTLVIRTQPETARLVTEQGQASCMDPSWLDCHPARDSACGNAPRQASGTSWGGRGAGGPGGVLLPQASAAWWIGYHSETICTLLLLLLLSRLSRV